MFVNGSGRKVQSLQRTCHRCFLPSFGSFGQAVSEKIFLEIDQSETRIARGSHVWMGQNEHLYRGPSIDAFYQVTVHLAKWS